MRGGTLCMKECVPHALLGAPSTASQVQNEARIRQGQVMTFFKGTGKPEEAMLSANDDVAALFREMIHDVERNYATQVQALHNYCDECQSHLHSSSCLPLVLVWRPPPAGFTLASSPLLA